MKHPLKQVNGKYGAPMGRTEKHLTGNLGPIKLHLERVHLDSGGYDRWGAYWGLRPSGQKLYRYYWAGNRTNSPILIDGFLDARTRELAKAVIVLQYPQATFYN